MKDKVEAIKDTILKIGVRKIPDVVWAFVASYALFMATNIVVLKFSDIDANQHISRYLDITLNAKESLIKSNDDFREATENQNILIAGLIKSGKEKDIKIEKVLKRVVVLEEVNIKLLENSHKPANIH